MTLLSIEDWLYHTFHLATLDESCEEMKDCKVCLWYRKLKPDTQKMVKYELREHS